MAPRIQLRKVFLRPRGKNSKVAYYWRCLCHQLTPIWWLRSRYKSLMKSLDSRADYAYIKNRVDYYCKLDSVANLRGEWQLGMMPKGKNNYFRDFFEYARFFNQSLRVDTFFGDNILIPDTPRVLKSRPIADDNQNAVVINMDKVRHFVFLNDKRSFESKYDMAICRGAMCQPHRRLFMEKYFGTEWVDCGDTSGKKDVPNEWRKPLITLYDHLKYKFVISLEGNDVASNLKWVMSSNSIAVMPKPKFETWFMEGKLVGGYHYIEIKDDYSDLPEKLAYYSTHVDEAEAIIAHAHEYVNQFRDKDREDLIHLLVLKKYFEMTNPSVSLLR